MPKHWQALLNVGFLVFDVHWSFMIVLDQRKLFHEKQLVKHASAHLPPLPGDTTPPNPEYSNGCKQDEAGRPLEKNFCVWTSMLKRSIDTAQHFDEEDYDVKQMRMLNELNAGIAEGMTYVLILTCRHRTACAYNN